MPEDGGAMPERLPVHRRLARTGGPGTGTGERGSLLLMAATPLLAGAVIADLSRWNVETEPQFATAVKAGLAGVIVKYTQGLDHDDPTAIEHAWDAYGAGVELLGGYHFGDASDPAAQARHFLGAMRADYGGVLDGCLVMLDLEGNGSSTMSVT